MNRTLVLAAVAAAALGGASLTGLTIAQSVPDTAIAPAPGLNRTISVSGSGRSAAAADRAVLPPPTLDQHGAEIRDELKHRKAG